MKPWQEVTFGVLIGVLSCAVILLIAADPPGHSVELLPAPTEEPILVHVAGAVNSPGVITLQAGSRVQHAVDMAGGFREDANQQAVNLAAQVDDGDQILIPKVGEPYTQTSRDSSTGQNYPDGEPVPLVNVNYANQSELEKLPAIGPTRATAILEYRRTNGLFLSIDDLMKVPGISPAIFEQFKAFVTVVDE